MTSEHSALQRFLENPANFEELVSDYEDEVDCYTSLRDEAKKILPSFNEYFQFFTASIDEGPTEFVFNDLNRNAIRSLKNMVLRSSRAGRQFPITSAAELQRRVEAFRDLGVDSVTPHSVIFTLLEHIFDDDKHETHSYEIIDHLLTETPDAPSELVALLVRARFVLATETLNPDSAAVDTHIEKLYHDLPDTIKNDNRSASELIEAATEKSYDNTDKIDLVRGSLARQDGGGALEEFLYLSARDVVERCRHQNREDPWRGELQLTLRQFNCLENLYSENWSKEREARSKSYRQLVLGELDSGGRWRSQRDPTDLPDPDFLSAANRYFQAAHEIESVDVHRYIKYLSKSFRHQATAAQKRELGPGRGWVTSRVIHDKAIERVTQTINHESNVDQDKLTDTIVGVAATHKFRRHQAAAVAAFERRNPESAFEEADEAWDHLDATPIYENTDLLETIGNLTEALLFEMQGEFEEALNQYQDSDNSKLDIQNRITLLGIKYDVDQGNYDTALTEALDTFGEDSPIVTAVQLIAGKSPPSPSIQLPILGGLSAVDSEVMWSFIMSTYLYSTTEKRSSIAQDQIKESLLEL